MAIIAPSILSADFGNLNKDIELLNSSSAEWIHIDIMDGVFVPNISFGFPIMEAINKKTEKFMDVHLMISHPDSYLQKFKELGADLITVHFETCPHLHRTIQLIKDLGVKAGIAINPHTAVKNLENLIIDIDMVLVMSVNPGFGGQKFIENSYKKVKETKELILQSGSSALIEVDGGVNLQNAAKLIEMGADILVAGSAIFNTKNPLKSIEELKAISK